MKRFLMYFLSIIFVLGTSSAFAGVYGEDFEDNILNPMWYAYEKYEISNGIMHMTAGKDYMGIKESEVGIWFEEEFVYHFSADIKVPEGYNQIVGIGLQWGNIDSGPWDGYQVFLKFYGDQVWAVLGRIYPGGGDLVDSKFLMQGSFNTWYNLSMTLHNNYITCSINGIKSDLFHNLFSYDPALIKLNVAYVHAHDGIPDINYYTDNLKAFTSSGTSPNDIMDSVIGSVDEWIESGQLVGTGQGGSAEVHLNTLQTMLGNAQMLLNNDNIAGACHQLKNASNRSDGLFPPPDFIEGDAVQDLQKMISLLMTDMGCE